MEKKISREDFEALLRGEKDVSSYFDLEPGSGTMSVFGVRTSSNPDYVVRAVYDLFEKSLERKLAVNAVKNLYRSVGLGSVGLNRFLSRMGLTLGPADFLYLVFLLQHQQGWGAPLAIREKSETRIVLRTDHTFESQVMKDWKMRVCGIHAGWIEGVLTAVTGKTWVCEEIACHAAGDGYCEFAAVQREVTWREKVDSIVKGDAAVTEYLEHRPLEGKVKFIDEPVVMMPAFIFTSMMGSMKKIVGEAAAGGIINYRAYQDLGAANVAYFRNMGITDPDVLVMMALTLYSQMGWFQVVRMDWNEEKKEKVLTLLGTAESEAFGAAGKPVCHCTSGLIAGIVGSAFGVTVQGKEIRCRSKGDPECVFVVTNKT